MAKESEDPKPSPKKKSNGAVIALMLVLLAGGTGGWIVVHNRAANSAPQTETQRVKSVLHLESFTVNLADGEDRGFLRVGIDLGLGQVNQPSHEFPIAPVRDAIIEVLSAQKSQDLLTPAGKRQMKEQIFKELQQRTPELQVQEIYFTDFLVQR